MRFGVICKRLRKINKTIPKGMALEKVSILWTQNCMSACVRGCKEEQARKLLVRTGEIWALKQSKIKKKKNLVVCK